MNRMMLMASLLAMFAAATVESKGAVKQAPKMSDDPVGKLVLVENGKNPIPIVIPKNPAPFVSEAATDLANYVKKISGAKPDILEGASDPLPKRAIYVGYQPILKKLFPNIDFNFKHPEEILFAADGKNLVICGRDRSVPAPKPDEKGNARIPLGSVHDKDRNLVWTEHGTSCAVYQFIEDCLDVRWVLPRELGEDVVESDTIAFPPFEYRFHPVIRKRHLWPRWLKNWYRRQRIYYYSYPFSAGHAFTKWWEKYHDDHPEWFALDKGTRLRAPSWGGSPNPKGAKLCVSNPEVWNQWLIEAGERLKNDPSLSILSATPNDGPGFCVCAKCRAMDHPDAPGECLTERYVKFWNILARGLKERFPNRDVDVGGYAYSAYREPPIDEKLEENIAIGFVGHFPFASDAWTERQKKDWKAWADMATRMVFRPNLFHSSGGFIGLPNVALKGTAEGFKFLADNKNVGIEVDTLPNAWSIQGPQYYIMAQLTYDPSQDAEALMKDYFQRGYGPAAAEIERYFQLMEETNEAVLEKLWLESGKNRGGANSIFLKYWGDPKFIAKAEKLLNQAAAKLADGPEKYRKRLDYVKVGLDFLKMQVRIFRAMAEVKRTAGGDKALVKKALDLFDERDAMMKAAPYCAIRAPRGMKQQRKMLKDFLDSKVGPPITLEPAKWSHSWKADFANGDLNADWTVRDGNWSIKDGSLESRGGMLITKKTFPGLQKLEFNASITPDEMGVVSDLSPIIQCNEKGRGYMMQFGGYKNSMSSIQRLGKIQIQDNDHVITPGKVHHIVAELNGNMARLIIDGETAVEFKDPRPLIGEDHQRVGFYVYAGKVKITDVKVHTANPQPIKVDPDAPVDPDAVW